MTRLHPIVACLLCALLLFVQQTALAHVAWHAAHDHHGHAHAGAAGEDHGDDQPEDLCPLHALLGQTLEAAPVVCSPHIGTDAPDAAPCAARATSIPPPFVRPRSRAPPQRV